MFEDNGSAHQCVLVENSENYMRILINLNSKESLRDVLDEFEKTSFYKIVDS